MTCVPSTHVLGYDCDALRADCGWCPVLGRHWDTRSGIKLFHLQGEHISHKQIGIYQVSLGFFLAYDSMGALV
jgi:hypothetical protein